MDSSFHYCMTYAAARAAGFSSHNAGQIALYAQCVDESMGYNVTHKHAYKFTRLNRKATPYEKDVGLQMTQHWLDDRRQRERSTFFGGGKGMGRTADMMILMSFHFLPGMQSPSEVDTGIDIIDDTVRQYALSSGDRAVELMKQRSKQVRKRARRKKISATDQKIERAQERMRKRASGQMTKTDYKEMLITWPSSRSSQDMMEDTLRKVRAECSNGLNGDLINQFSLWRGINLRQPRIKTLGELARDKRINIGVRDFLLALVGIRMHLFADTFAHQGFSGPRTGRVNDAVSRKFRERYSQDALTEYPDDNKALALWAGGIKAGTKKQKYWLMTPQGTGHVGHGALGALPDYPNCYYEYTRPRDGKTIERDNPRIYYWAYQHMYHELAKLPDELKNDMMVGARSNTNVSDHLVTDHYFEKDGMWPDGDRGADWIRDIVAWDADAEQTLTKEIVDGKHARHHALHRMSLPQRHTFSLAASHHLWWMGDLINRLTGRSVQLFLNAALTKEGDRSVERRV